jgi:hypothetical protein
LAIPTGRLALWEGLGVVSYTAYSTATPSQIVLIKPSLLGREDLHVLALIANADGH